MMGLQISLQLFKAHLISANEPGLALFALVLQFVLLAHTVVVFCLEGGDALLHLLQARLSRVQDPLSLCQLFLGDAQPFPLRCHSPGHKVIFVHGPRPQADGRAGF